VPISNETLNKSFDTIGIGIGLGIGIDFEDSHPVSIPMPIAIPTPNMPGYKFIRQKEKGRCRFNGIGPGGEGVTRGG